MNLYQEIPGIIAQFAVCGEIIQIEPIKKGYINQTYKVELRGDDGHTNRYILQRINTNVFPDIDALMSNFQLTTRQLSAVLQMPGRHEYGSAQTLHLTKDGKLCLQNESGSWRMMTYFDHVYSMDIPDSPEVFYYAGVSFGRFIKAMSGVDVSEVREVIPNFHNTKSRYRDLEEAISRDPQNRVGEVAGEIAFVRAHTDLFGRIAEALEAGYNKYVNSNNANKKHPQTNPLRAVWGCRD